MLTHREDRICKCTSIVRFLRQSLTEDNLNRTGRTKKRKALVVCTRQTEVLHADSYGRLRLGPIIPRIQTFALG
jgi:hypothetical protein